MPLKLEKLSRMIEENGGDNAIFDRMAAGWSSKRIMEEYGYTGAMLGHWIHLDPEREKRWNEIRQIQAHQYADEALNVLYEQLEKNPPPSVEARLRKELSRKLAWKAEKLNRKAYGEEKGGVNVTVDVGELHLDALRAGGHMPAREITSEAEVELLEEGEGDE